MWAWAQIECANQRGWFLCSLRSLLVSLRQLLAVVYYHIRPNRIHALSLLSMGACDWLIWSNVFSENSIVHRFNFNRIKSKCEPQGDIGISFNQIYRCMGHSKNGIINGRWQQMRQWTNCVSLLYTQHFDLTWTTSSICSETIKTRVSTRMWHALTHRTDFSIKSHISIFMEKNVY